MPVAPMTVAPAAPSTEGPVEDGGGGGGGDAPSSHLRQVDDAQQLPHVLGGEQPVPLKPMPTAAQKIESSFQCWT